MSEKYFASIIIILFLTATLLSILLLLWHWRLKYLQNLARINILKRQQKSNRSTFFATYVINRCCYLLYLRRNTATRAALAQLVAGYTEKAFVQLFRFDWHLAFLLRAHTDLDAVYKQMKKHKKIWLTHPKYAVFLPLIAYLSYDRQTMQTSVQKLDFSPVAKVFSALAAYRALVFSLAYSYEGEMLSASQAASQALKFFQKKQFAVETAACHLVLADIYRISCVNDIAETMIDSAVKIYQIQKAPLLMAKAIVAKGMLMIFENRYKEAHSYYEKAIDMPITEQLRGDIYNQQALLELAENHLPAARKKIKMALSIQQKLKNRFGTAYSLQLEAQIAFAEKHHRTAVQKAKQAAELYFLQHNYSAYAECLYLIAVASFKEKHYKQAENKLREILKLNRKYSLNFHVANAYSLLGLIYMQKHDLQRAKVLFQQSLHLEQSKQRCEGMIADYANLALIDELTDNAEGAKSNWQIALEYAYKLEDTQLKEMIERHCNK